MKIGIVEDELIIADGIAEMLRSFGHEVIEPCTNYNEAIGMLHADNPDLVLLDIRLRLQKDGIEVAKYIRENRNIPLIFISSNSDPETVARAKDVRPEAFLVKPFKKADLFTAIEIAQANFTSREEKPPGSLPNMVADALFIKDGYYYHKVAFDDILFLSSDNVYVNVHTACKKHVVRASLSEYLEKFDPARFLRVHQRYAINIYKVDKINSAYVLIGKEDVPVSKPYYKQLLASLNLG
jgi:DNA-binding LytR/AlgR family response regulator